ncbi:HlyD family secretion protein [Novosphingobium sp.]|uniref:HlyD family secretion protein n=1 Tax=Novosphingobium sp. TaxID=1874826 RepID=UPI002736E5B3|nr:HlyD family secretion protein [Novosphingobium sp.]MDP3907421.1 HlyD family secretion protein [Novosphingobium sp.]
MAEADPTFPAGDDTVPNTDAAAPPPKRHFGRLLAMLSVPVLILTAGSWYWLSLQGQVSTDNAYVKQDKVSVSAEISGRIIAVAVRDNQTVKAGDLLFQIDPEPYQLQIAQSDAAIAAAQANVVALSNASALSGSDIAAARESVAFAQSNFVRQQALMERGFTTKAAFDAAQHTVQQAREELNLAQAKAREASARLATGAQVPGVNPQVAQARAQRAAAELNLRRTDVRAPIAGRLSQASRLLVGQQAISGLPVVTIVASQGGYVEANFKETDLDRMRPGQRAEIRFDAYPDVTLNGHVASIGAGTGSEFSMLPAQNATGNWVKVTQRVAVRIALDDASPRPLLAGLSAKVKVLIDDTVKR